MVCVICKELSNKNEKEIIAIKVGKIYLSGGEGNATNEVA